ncbi:cupin domain-containing protein [Massilia sp. 9096]|uniref:cupin domain-containing protein n=1 Tax=Massilia sp. 9096 TaxID=1500894 RepID=UPI0009DDF9F5|nr:cupin domain-containing protein [Massilia sp. 9096]
MSRLDLSSIPVLTGTGYPEAFAEAVNGRSKQVLGDAGGLTQFGVNLVELQPGAASSQRHWHTHEDEFVMIVSGELTLITDEGETLMRAGDCAAFPAGRPNGHHLVNRSWGTALFLAVGSRIPEDSAEYPDIDLKYDGKTDSYLHRDGTPYPKAGAAGPSGAHGDSPLAAQLPIEEETLEPRVFRADHGEQDAVKPGEPR